MAAKRPARDSLFLSDVKRARYAPTDCRQASSSEHDQTLNEAPQATSENELASTSTRSQLALFAVKPDHEARPLLIDATAEYPHIVLEAFASNASAAEEFLTTIAEPVSRPSLMREYKLTPYSLWAAASVGLQAEDIVEVLDRLSKYPVPEEVNLSVQRLTASFGKARLVIRGGHYFIESNDVTAMDTLLADSMLRSIIVAIGGPKRTPVKAQLSLLPHGMKSPSSQELFDAVIGLDDEDEDQELDYSFEVSVQAIETLKQRCITLGYPLLEEYDYRTDLSNPHLDIDLRRAVTVRPYQEKALSKMFGNGLARSGIIVLPCGAGKTLVGVSAACTVKKSCLVICTSSVSVQQWQAEFLKWSTVPKNKVAAWTANAKDTIDPNCGIVITTYSMLAVADDRRADDTKKAMSLLTAREWGLMVLDEVHVAPATMFKNALGKFKAHLKLGLTATLVREDDKIEHLNHLIGPKLYEANWMALAEQGHIAKVICTEIRCPMSPEFFDAYIRTTNHRKRPLLYWMNPTKIAACRYLIDKHEAAGDNIVVFCDNVWTLRHYAETLGKPFIDGSTVVSKREDILRKFKDEDPDHQTIFLSKIGDTSLDMPAATCLIQISAHYGSRRQEAQRLGRILRARRRDDPNFRAHFYTLVSSDTEEVGLSAKRQEFLINQGYAFNIVSSIDEFPVSRLADAMFRSPDERLKLLDKVMMVGEDVVDDEPVRPKPKTKKQKKEEDVSRHSLFRKRDREAEKRRQERDQESVAGPSNTWTAW